MKKKFDKEDLFHLYHCSDLGKGELTTILKEDVYSNKKDWTTFMEILFLILGSGLLVIGVLFFFAYNWTALHTFLKFGIIGAILTIAVCCSVYNKIPILYRRIALLCASLLIGILYAVFGQEYQTGANAYDFFLAWLMSITIWTLTSKFPFQWLMYGLLGNATLMLCFGQVFDSESVFTYLLGLLITNIMLFIVPNSISYFRKNTIVPQWYNKIYITVVTLISTQDIIVTIFSTDFLRYNESRANLVITLCISLGWIGGLLWRAIVTKTFYYYSTAIVSCFFILLGLLVKIFDFTIFSTLLYAIYFIGGTFGVVNYLMKTFKKWQDE
ncbi:MAG: DUF2157 domain-containing protein [Flavobacteriaceae bacterium]|jgi:uncharacterized membrane protein|nr:DUF2157 domain-containing protein [Flavobacteriaceae bacterium]